MKKIKYISLSIVAGILIFVLANHNNDYANCMEATNLDYISKEGADHISAQCNAFIKQKIMVK